MCGESKDSLARERGPGTVAAAVVSVPSSSRLRMERRPVSEEVSSKVPASPASPAQPSCGKSGELTVGSVGTVVSTVNR